MSGRLEKPTAQNNPELASATLKSWLEKYKSAVLTLDKPDIFDKRWSRAASGWNTRTKLNYEKILK
ncbi:MAG: hypothetical protein K2X93_21955 [Candidatus Obscuribacterales bacterium]|nr:hypothetical protein [Candidatus Obscuribacterales bacterium]